MMDFLISILIVLITSHISWNLWKNYRNVRIVRRTLRCEISLIEKKLRFWEGEPDRQFQLLKPIYTTALFELYPKLKMKRSKLEQLINDEINRIVKYPIRARVHQVFQSFKVIMIVAMLFISIYGVEQVITEFKNLSVEKLTQSFKGTLDDEAVRDLVGGVPKVQGKEETQEEKSPEPSPKEEPEEVKTPKTKKSDVQAESIHYLLPINTYPTQVATTEELGEAIAYHMELFDESFTIQFTGDPAIFDQATDDVWEWLSQHESVFYEFL